MVIVILAGISSASAQGVSPGEGGGDVSRPFATHLDRPEAVVPLSGDAVLVAERSGRVVRFDASARSDLGMITVPGTRVFSVPERLYTEGLKDLIASPGRPGMFLWGMTTGSAEALRWTVGRARWSAPDTGTPSGVIFKSGFLWEVEHGPKGGDELNLIVPGGDYGWTEVSQGEPDDENHRSFLRNRSGSIDPVVTWTPAIAPSSLTDWRGKFYVGTLKGEAVIELTMNGNAVVFQRRILELGQRIRGVRAGFDERVLWVLTDGPDAELFQVTPNPAKPDSR